MYSERKKFIRIIKEYSDYSTIAGVLYIVSSGQSTPARLFWIVWTSILLGFGLYWSIIAYNDWTSSPVITTLSSAAVPLDKVPFPAVIFCSKGIPTNIYLAAFTRTLMEFLKKNLNYKFKYSPIENILENSKKPFGIAYEFLPSPDEPELNIMVNKVFLNNTNILELAFEGMKATPSNYNGMTATYLFNFFMQKRINIFMSSLMVSFYMFFSQQTDELFQFQIFFDKLMQKDFQEFGKPFLDTFYSNLRKTNLSEIFPSLISHLWHSKLPCFDKIGITALEDNDSSFIKNCNWKHISIPCASIFTMVPTDLGLCCAFNTDDADDIYAESLFSKTILALQADDRNVSFESSQLPYWYVNNKEPWSKAGITMGLEVTLDAHTDLLDAYSIDSSFGSFQALIQHKGDFPLVSRGGFRLLRGFHNLVALSGTIISADDSLRVIGPENRQCLYPDENNLKLFKVYSQSNCIFECLLTAAQSKAIESLNLSQPCYLWYYPFSTDTTELCDPWTSNYIESIWNKSNETCEHCLPDCNTFTYKYSLSHEPLRNCDDFNIGISKFCKFQQVSSSYKPLLWGKEVFDQLKSDDYKWLITDGRSRQRIVNSLFSGTAHPFFENTLGPFDAYKRDISVVSVFFSVPTVWIIQTTASLTWITFFSNVGGLLGLCVGTSFVTVIELVWLGLIFFLESNIRKIFRNCMRHFKDFDEAIQDVNFEN